MNESDNTSLGKEQKNSDYWRQHYEACQSSGFSRARYCREHQLVYHRFLYWHRKFSEAGESKAEARDFLAIQWDWPDQSASSGIILATLKLGSDQGLLLHTPQAIEAVISALSRKAC